METKQERKKGPVPGPQTERYQVLLEPDTAEWAKHNGGLSEIIRKLLREAYERSPKINNPAP